MRSYADWRNIIVVSALTTQGDNSLFALIRQYGYRVHTLNCVKSDDLLRTCGQTHTHTHTCFSKKFKSWFTCVTFFTLHGWGGLRWHGWLAVMKNALKTTLLCCFVMVWLTLHISYQAKNLPKIRLTVRRIQYLEHNIFHIRAIKEYSELDNKTTNAHALNMFYPMSLTTIMLRSLLPSSGTSLTRF